jgi:hypothetical protein
MYSELAQYVEPKRKALEHSGDVGVLEAFLMRIDAGEFAEDRSGRAREVARPRPRLADEGGRGTA